MLAHELGHFRASLRSTMASHGPLSLTEEQAADSFAQGTLLTLGLDLKAGINLLNRLKEHPKLPVKSGMQELRVQHLEMALARAEQFL